MSMPIERQSAQYDVFDQDRWQRDRVASYDEDVVSDMLHGPSIQAGLLNTRRAAAGEYNPFTSPAHEEPGFNPFKPKAAPQDPHAVRPGAGEHLGPAAPKAPSVANPSNPFQQIPTHEAPGFNPFKQGVAGFHENVPAYPEQDRRGPHDGEPDREPYDEYSDPEAGYGFPGGNDHVFHEDPYVPDTGGYGFGQGMPGEDYDPHSSENVAGQLGNYDQPPAHFSAARHLAEDGGPALEGAAFNPNVFQPGDRQNGKSELFGGDEDRWVTALALQPAQPAAPAAPVWLGHTFAPGHRVGMPWRDTTIPGTVTHLEGTNVGVRWDDGQHSVEEPAGIRPLHQ